MKVHQLPTYIWGNGGKKLYKLQAEKLLESF